MILKYTWTIEFQGKHLSQITNPNIKQYPSQEQLSDSLTSVSL